jgi:hypothetical protein
MLFIMNHQGHSALLYYKKKYTALNMVENRKVNTFLNLNQYCFTNKNGQLFYIIIRVKILQYTRSIKCSIKNLLRSDGVHNF